MPPTTPKRLARPNDATESERDGPIRQCVGCRTRLEKVKLLRFVRTGGQWEPDPVARREGRGAYICSPQCVERVKKNKKYKGLALVTVPPSTWPAR